MPGPPSRLRAGRGALFVTTMRYDVVEELEETGAVEEAVRRGIRGSDPPDVGARNWERVCLSLRDETGSIAGGVYGATMWGWLMGTACEFSIMRLGLGPRRLRRGRRRGQRPIADLRA